MKLDELKCMCCDGLEKIIDKFISPRGQLGHLAISGEYSKFDIYPLTTYFVADLDELRATLLKVIKNRHCLQKLVVTKPTQPE